MGDVQIFDPDYRKSPSLHQQIEDVPALLERLEAAGFVASPRLLGSALAAAGDASAGIGLRGVDPARDRRVSEVSLHVEKGTWLDPADPTGYG